MLQVVELALVVLLILLVVVVVVVVLDRRGRDGRMMGRPSDERRAHVERGRPVDRLDAGRRRRRRLQRWRHPLLVVVGRGGGHGSGCPAVLALPVLHGDVQGPLGGGGFVTRDGLLRVVVFAFVPYAFRLHRRGLVQDRMQVPVRRAGRGRGGSSGDRRRWIHLHYAVAGVRRRVGGDLAPIHVGEEDGGVQGLAAAAVRVGTPGPRGLRGRGELRRAERRGAAAAGVAGGARARRGGRWPADEG